MGGGIYTEQERFIEPYDFFQRMLGENCFDQLLNEVVASQRLYNYKFVAYAKDAENVKKVYIIVDRYRKVVYVGESLKAVWYRIRRNKFNKNIREILKSIVCEGGYSFTCVGLCPRSTTHNNTDALKVEEITRRFVLKKFPKMNVLNERS